MIRKRKERLRLYGIDRLVYFAPVVFVGWLTLLCLSVVLVCLLFVTVPDPLAIVGAALFGVIVTLALGVVLLWAQRRDLEFSLIETGRDAASNYRRLFEESESSGWTIITDHPDEELQVAIAGSFLSRGEILVARFRGSEVLIASISDPRIGFSLTARERCRRNVAQARAALQSMDFVTADEFVSATAVVIQPERMEVHADIRTT